MIKYVIGDATLPQGSDPKVIVHCCNDIGGWGAGFVLALSKQWPFSEDAYRQWARAQHNPVDHLFPDRCETSGPFKLGEVQFVLVGPKLWAANLIGHNGFEQSTRPPIG